MASLRKASNGHEIVFTDSKRDPTQVALYFGSEFSKNEVKKLKTNFEQDYTLFKYDKGGRDPWKIAESNNPTIKTAVSNLIHHKTQVTEAWSEGTRQNEQSVLKRFSRMYGDTRIKNLSTGQIDKFVNKGDVAKATRESRLRPIKTLLNWLNVNKELPPIRGNKQEKQVKYILQYEVNLVNQTILDKVQSDIEKGYQTENRNSFWLVNLLSWSFYSGMRPSETLTLEPKDYDRRQKIVRVRRKTKNRYDRELHIGKIPILKRIMDNLTDPKVRENQSDNPYWKSDRIFGHYDQKRTSKNIKKYIRLAFKDRNPDRGEKLSWYSYRHGCAVWLLSNDTSIYSVSNWLGHKSVETTEEYYADIAQTDLGSQIAQAHQN